MNIFHISLLCESELWLMEANMLHFCDMDDGSLVLINFKLDKVRWVCATVTEGVTAIVSSAHRLWYYFAN